MRPINPTSRRGSRFGLVVGIFLALSVGGAGAVASLWALGVPIPFLSAADNSPKVLIPANFRPISAYSVVTRDDLINVEKKALNHIELSPQQVVGMPLVGVNATGQEVKGKIREYRIEKGQIIYVTDDGQEVSANRVNELGGSLMNPNDIIGRVMARDKTPNLAFSEGVLLPKGTRPGLAGATPPGMQALTLEAGKISGVHGMKLGDKIDLIAAVPLDILGEFDSDYRQRRGRTTFVAKTKDLDHLRAVEERMVAQGAILISPVHIRQKPTTTSTLTQGQRVQTVPVEEFVVALLPADVAPLKKAVDKELKLTAVAHSARGSDDKAAEKTEPDRKLSAAFPIVKRPIPAFQRLKEEDFVDPVTRRPEFSYLDPEVAKRRKVVPYEFLIGRIVNRDIEPGQVLTETELAPHGAEAGIGSVIPPDRQAVVIDAGKLAGAELLSVGDHLDVVGSFSLEYEQQTVETERLPGDRTRVREFSAIVNRPTEFPWADSLGHRGEHWFLAIDAVVVAIGRPQETQAPASGQASKSVSFVTIAVALRDVESLSQALAQTITENRTKMLLTAALRSNLPLGASTNFASVPLCPVHLRAFEPLGPWDAALRRPGVIYLSLQEVKDKKVITDLPKYAGRVLRQNKLPGEYFTENDFFPATVKPGVAAGIPAGTRGFSLSKDQLVGIGSLRQGGRVDVLASRKVVFPSNYDVPGGWTGRIAVNVVAQNAEVVQTYSEPNVGVVSALLAVPADDAGRFEEALRIANELRVLPRNGNGVESVIDPLADDSTPNFDPYAGTKFIERIVGSNRRVAVFPPTGTNP